MNQPLLPHKNNMAMPVKVSSKRYSSDELRYAFNTAWVNKHLGGRVKR